MLSQSPLARYEIYRPLPGEQTAIEEFRTGSLEAFNQIVLFYQDLLFRVAVRILGDEPAAMDIVQETFITVFSKFHQFRGNSLRAWLIRIAVNKSYDVLRSNRHRLTMSFESIYEDWSEEKFHTPSSNKGLPPEVEVEMRELEKNIQICIGKLPPRLRSVILLVDAEELSYAEAAEALQIPVGTVKSRLARARSKMQSLLLSSGVALEEPRRDSITG